MAPPSEWHNNSGTLSEVKALCITPIIQHMSLICVWMLSESQPNEGDYDDAHFSLTTLACTGSIGTALLEFVATYSKGLH